jgi:hypothetical protein
MATKPSKVSSVVQEDLVPLGDRIQQFANLLDELDTLSDKKKALWKEIYANAVTDRNNALILYNSLIGTVMLNDTNHAIHAQNMAKYIEKMSRSNDQLLKLAELIAAAEEKADEINADNIYSALEDEEEKS